MDGAKMTISRRNFLRNSAAAGAAGVAATSISGCASPVVTLERVMSSEDLPTPFQHNIASGDPTESSALIWTRVTQRDEDGNFISGDVPVSWRVFRDPELTNLVASGNYNAAEATDYCVKVDVTGLSAYTAYYYQFSALGFDSAIGRFQTLPDWDVDTDNRLRVAVVSCSNYPHGYFHIYRKIAERNDIDLVVHLGDYLYEYGDGEYGDTRLVDPPHEMISLDDYRRRHALYKTDPDLAKLHQQYAFINIWDDHETTDNSRKCTANNHTEASEEGLAPSDPNFNEGYWYERKNFGIQAFFEWMPIRPVEDDVAAAGDLFSPAVGKTWRKFAAGKFLDLIMIDTRIWGRDDQADGAAFQREDVRDYQSTDPDCGDTTVHRDILGPDQEQWLHDQLRNSTAKWKVIGNQLIMSHLRTTPSTLATPATYLNTDAWDGYPTSQERLYEVLQGNNMDGSDNPNADSVDNVVVITGDIHTSWAFDVTPNPDELPAYNPIGVEFVGPSITSPGVPIPGETANALSAANTHLKYTNLEQKGWILLDLSPDFATGEWYHYGGDEAVDSPDDPGDGTLARVYRTSSAAGSNGLESNSPDITGTDKQTQPSEAYLASRPARAPEPIAE
jgi:alkaline phosphatase D